MMRNYDEILNEDSERIISVALLDVTGYGEESHSLPLNDVISLIKSLESFIDDSNYSGFNFPDYYAAFSGLQILKLGDLLSAFYAQIINQQPSKRGIKIFLSKGRKIEMYSEEYTLRVLMASDIIISGCRISKELKLSCIEFMQDNDIPIFPNCFRILIRRYMETGSFYLIPLTERGE